MLEPSLELSARARHYVIGNDFERTSRRAIEYQTELRGSNRRHPLVPALVHWNTIRINRVLQGSHARWGIEPVQLKGQLAQGLYVHYVTLTRIPVVDD